MREAHTTNTGEKPRVLCLWLVVYLHNCAGETSHDKARGKGNPAYKGHRGVENEAYSAQEVTTKKLLLPGSLPIN